MCIITRESLTCFLLVLCALCAVIVPQHLETMVCVGSKTIKRKKLKPSSSDTGDEEDTSKRRGRKKGKDKKPREGHSRLPEGSSSKKRQNRKIKEKNLGKRPHDRVKNEPSEGSSKSGNGKNLKSSKNFEPSKPVQSILRFD